MFKQTSIPRATWAAVFIASCFFVASPFFLVDHDHLGTDLSEQCAVCSLVSAAFDSPENDHPCLFTLACSGEITPTDDAAHISDPPIHNGVRAPPPA